MADPRMIPGEPAPEPARGETISAQCPTPEAVAKFREDSLTFGPPAWADAPEALRDFARGYLRLHAAVAAGDGATPGAERLRDEVAAAYGRLEWAGQDQASFICRGAYLLAALGLLGAPADEEGRGR